MKLVIVSGHSGSGKSIALNTLEDMGYYCIDNLPAGLLNALSVELERNPTPIERAAVGIDARNLLQALKEFTQILVALRAKDIQVEVLFLTSDHATLVKRFSETRRRHPLSSALVPLAEAIEKERQLLEPIASTANLFIDTSNTNVHELRDLVRDRIERKDKNSMSLSLQSFGYKHGIPNDADFVFDARCLPNPHWQPELRPLTGRDEAVANFLSDKEEVKRMLSELSKYLDGWIPSFDADNRSYLTIAIGCTGGQHRSVYLTEQLANHFRARYPNIVVRHRELP